MRCNVRKQSKILVLCGLFMCLVGLGFIRPSENEMKENHFILLTQVNAVQNLTHEHLLEQQRILEEKNKIVYDNMTFDELVKKLDRSLGSTLSGKGSLFASYSLELGLDPYLALAIVLEETGCKWGCSTLVRECNNVGGQKGSPSCGGGSYRSYPTLDEGIKGFMDNLYYNYVAKGLTTPEQINTRYAASKSWASKIRRYMNQIKNA